MGILEAAIPAVVICTRDRARATAFYRDVLGLKLASEDDFAAIFTSGGTTLRVSHVSDFVPHDHTMLGFRVADVRATVRNLRAKGLDFNRYGHIPQDEQGVFSGPGGIHVAWFSDPDGNVLSLTDV